MYSISSTSYFIRIYVCGGIYYCGSVKANRNANKNILELCKIYLSMFAIYVPHLNKFNIIQMIIHVIWLNAPVEKVFNLPDDIYLFELPEVHNKLYVYTTKLLIGTLSIMFQPQ